MNNKNEEYKPTLLEDIIGVTVMVLMMCILCAAIMLW